MDQFGLKTPPVQFSAKTADGKTLELLFGGENPRKTYNYAKLSGGNEVFLTASNWARTFTKTVSDLRNKKILEFETEDIDGLKIRHHGDFHLGQMLIVKDDIFIIDFEGEPRRPHAERRRKAPAARDVAGLIRSIDYSATAALERALKVASDEQGKLGAALGEWRDRATMAFLGAYSDIMTNARLWPADPTAAEKLLNFFLLEKAFYEIEYELAYRPDWLRVPLTGAIRILSANTHEAA